MNLFVVQAMSLVTILFFMHGIDRYSGTWKLFRYVVDWRKYITLKVADYRRRLIQVSNSTLHFIENLAFNILNY